MSWQTEFARLEAAPAIDQLRYIRKLEEDERLTPTEVLASLPRTITDGRRWGAAIARVIPRSRVLELLDVLDERRREPEWLCVVHWIWRSMGADIIPLLTEDLTMRRTSHSLVHLQWLSDVLEMRACIGRSDVASTLLRLISETSGELRSLAVHVAGYQLIFAEPVVDAIAEQLERLSRSADTSYDTQIDTENVLGLVARGHERTRRLASRIAPFFNAELGEVRSSASHAAVGVAEPMLLSMIARALARTANNDELVNERAVHAFALWQLGGADSYLSIAGAVDFIHHHLNRLLNVSGTDERSLDGLVRLADAPAWELPVLVKLAKIGSTAADAISRLRVPAKYSDAHVAYHEACWRSGLISASDAVKALDDDTSDDAWRLVVQTNLGTTEWRRKILTALESGSAVEVRGLVYALLRAPAVGATFLPALVRRRLDDGVWALWATAPREQFWATVDD